MAIYLDNFDSLNVGSLNGQGDWIGVHGDLDLVDDGGGNLKVHGGAVGNSGSYFNAPLNANHYAKIYTKGDEGTGVAVRCDTTSYYAFYIDSSGVLRLEEVTSRNVILLASANGGFGSNDYVTLTLIAENNELTMLVDDQPFAGLGDAEGKVYGALLTGTYAGIAMSGSNSTALGDEFECGDVSGMTTTTTTTTTSTTTTTTTSTTTTTTTTLPPNESIIHGELEELEDDDHPQYHNDDRGDIRYYQKNDVDDMLDGKQNHLVDRYFRLADKIAGSISNPLTYYKIGHISTGVNGNIGIYRLNIKSYQSGNIAGLASIELFMGRQGTADTFIFKKCEGITPFSGIRVTSVVENSVIIGYDIEISMSSICNLTITNEYDRNPNDMPTKTVISPINLNYGGTSATPFPVGSGAVMTSDIF